LAQKIIIASGKGGVGKSSLTIGLARALSAKDRRVMVMDFDIGLRSLDILFGVTPQVVFDWGDVLSGRCDPKHAFLKLKEKLFFVSAPLRMRDEFSPGALGKMAAILNSSFDYLLFDSPAGLTSPGFVLAAGISDSAVLVSTPDDLCVRSVAAAARELTRFGVREQRLLINRLTKKPILRGKLPNIDEVIDATGVRLLGVVPEDFGITEYFSKGLPLPNDNFANLAFQRIAGRMEDEPIPLDVKII